MTKLHLLARDDGGYEQIVMCELLIPDTPNTYGDIYTREAIKEFVYKFAMYGFGLDVNHDEVNVDGIEWVIVESFIARPGDPLFIDGSWVIGAKILDDSLWQRILNGDINGFSFQADCFMTPVVIENLSNRQVVGQTMPNLDDGHTHPFVVLLDPLNKPISGGTGIVNGHSHTITSHTTTDYASAEISGNHNHRYQVIQSFNQVEGGNDVAAY